MKLAKKAFAAGALIATSTLCIAEVPPLPQETLEAMPFRFSATVQSVDTRPTGHNGCSIDTNFEVALENVESLDDARMPQEVKLAGTGREFQNGCLGGSGASILGKLRPGNKIIVYTQAPDANGTFHIDHRSQIKRDIK